MPPTSARLDRGGRPFRLCLRIRLQLAGREADAKATAEGLVDAVLLKSIPLWLREKKADSHRGAETRRFPRFFFKVASYG